MKDRLSESEKEELKNKISKSGDVPTSNLLEKLSSEITNNFKGEKNPGIYKDSVKKLLQLKEKIQNKTELSTLEKELDNLSSHLSEDKKKEFYLAIKGAKEILKNSRDLISHIKDEINIFTPTDGKFTTKIFGQANINKGKNPQNINEQLLGGGIGLFNSGEAIAKISVHLLIGVGKSIPDMYKILSGKGEYNGFKNV